MAACNQMPAEYTLQNSGVQDGAYTTVCRSTDNWYTYWGPNAWHFTFGPTGNGNTDQRSMTSMHISIPLVGYGGNASVYFDISGNFSGNNVTNLPTAEQSQATTLLQNNGTTLQMMAQEIVGYLV